MFRSVVLTMAVLIAGGMAQGVDFTYRSMQAPSNEVFVSGFQRFARLKKGDDGMRNRYNPTAGAVGYVYSQQSWQAGASFSYEHGSRKYDQGDTSMKVRGNTPGVTLFGGWVNPDGWYADASTFVGFSSLKARNLQTPGWNGGSVNTIHNTQFGASVELGKSFVMGNELVITPHVGFDYAHAPGESYRFGNSVNDFDFSSQNFYEIPLGLEVSRTYFCGDWAITPSFDLTLVNSVGNIDDYNYYSGFASRTAKDWKVYGVSGDHVGGRISAGINAKLGERTSLDFDYTFEGRKGYSDHRLSAMFGWSF